MSALRVATVGERRGGALEARGSKPHRVALAMESGGLSMTRSAASRPEPISTWVPRSVAIVTGLRMA